MYLSTITSVQSVLDVIKVCCTQVNLPANVFADLFAL